MRRIKDCLLVMFPAIVLALSGANTALAEETFRAGASTVDISPTSLPVIVNGGFLEKQASRVVDALQARAIVLDDGRTRLAICVVDTCMMPRELIDAAKELASQAARIPPDQMLVSATHTHTAPAAMACLGTRLDQKYASFLPGKIAEAIVRAAQNLVPARIGWAVAPAWESTNCRRWIRRPDRMLGDPFGVVSARANMHPGYENPDVIGPSGPIDPDLSLLSLQTRDGKPLALLANFSMHYFGAEPVSPDYFGQFARGIGKELGAGDAPAFVGIMSQGTSGDSHWMDYSRRQKSISSEQYAQELVRLAADACRRIEYRDFASLAMAEAKLTLRRRVADESRLQWARGIAGNLGDRVPANQPEVYALEQLFLAEEPERELKLQAIRVGDLGITAIPNEVYAITGLKLKAFSPLRPTVNIELANGAEGYIPPPEQHKLGGYTTWAARTAGLVPEAEPRIVETLLGLLEKVSGRPIRKPSDSHGPYSKSVLESRPVSYWRLNEFSPPTALDATVRGTQARYEDGIAMYLPGVQSAADEISAIPEVPSAFSGDQVNRSPHLAGGRIRADVPGLGKQYSVEFWFWNGLASTARPVTGYLVSRGLDGDQTAAGEHFGIGGTYGEGAFANRLFFFNGNESNTVVKGKRSLGLRHWHHVVLLRNERAVQAYLDGHLDVEGEADWTLPSPAPTLFLGGRCDNFANFEGRLDEVAVYDRILSAEEISRHYQAANRKPVPAASGASVPGASPAGAASVPSGENVPAPASLPLAPEESLKKIHVPAGFKVQLVAAEPLVLDPVAFDWDVAGRMWVVEMADYPLGMDGQGKPGGRVRVLEDRDEDGVFDAARIFADGLNFPTGILTWRDGVLVTAAPDILFLRDTNGDGTADEREVLFHGFHQGNQQLRLNGLRWGLDNWIYCANGAHHAGYGSDTRVESKRSGLKIDVGSRDFRFRPETGELELESGPSQFGRNRDPWGHWFGTQNAAPLWQYVLSDRYLSRNRHVPTPLSLKHIVGPGSPPVFPASPPEKRYHSFEQARRFTSACGAMVYGDERLFGSGAQLHAFTCEPFHNLVQHNVLTDSGVSFISARAAGEELHDFFASEDRWCRPVMARTGPDGSLWIADMYRYMIEHPQWLPPAGQAELLPHYRLGDDRGRIYRVSREELPAEKSVRLDRLDTAGLVAALDSPNDWRRDKAQQMLVWKQDPATIPLLIALSRSSSRPATRLQALCSLDGLGALTPELLLPALADEHARVRENALRLAETRETPELVAAAARLARDPDGKVRLQLALTLGEWETPAAAAALAELAVRDVQEPFMVAGVMSSAVPHAPALLSAVMKSEPAVVNAYAEALIRQMLGMGDLPATAAILTATASSERGDRMRVLASLLLAVERAGSSWQKLQALRGEQPALAAALGDVEKVIEQAAAVADHKDGSPGERIAAAALLCRVPQHRAAGANALAEWLRPQYPAETQAEAIALLTQSGADVVPSLLASAWPQLSPALRERALDAWLFRQSWISDLLERIENQEISANSLDLSRRDRLLRFPAKPIAERAARVLRTAVGETRAKVVEQYRGALTLSADPAAGKKVFTRACASCHKSGDEGGDLGPNLATVSSHSPEKLLVNILDPSADIQPGYQAYLCTLASGEILYGLLAAETANSLTIRLTDGTPRTLSRGEIDELRNTGKSLMPDELEKVILPQELADLVAFLRAAAR